jgi:cytochrome c5
MASSRLHTRGWRLSLGCLIALASGSSPATQQARPSGTPAGSTLRSQWSGIYTDAQAARGKPLYAENCAFCHGKDLEGTHSAPPVAAAALAARWQGQTLADLFDYQQVFMPWNSPGGFSRTQNADILAFMLKKSGLPAGTPLPTESDAQRQVRILAVKP